MSPEKQNMILVADDPGVPKAASGMRLAEDPQALPPGAAGIGPWSCFPPGPPVVG